VALRWSHSGIPRGVSRGIVAKKKGRPMKSGGKKNLGNPHGKGTISPQKRWDGVGRSDMYRQKKTEKMSKGGGGGWANYQRKLEHTNIY